MEHDDPDMQSLVNRRGRKRKEQDRFIRISEKEQKERLAMQRDNLEA